VSGGGGGARARASMGRAALAREHLLRHLLRLDGGGELLAELEVGDRDVLEQDVELGRALRELVAHLAGHGLALRDELLGVVLRDDGLEHLVADRRQHALVVVDAEVREDVGEVLLLGAREHAQVDRHDLQVLRARRRRDVARPYPHVELVRRLHPRDAEVRPLAAHCPLHAAEAVEHHRAEAAVDVVHRRLEERDAGADADGRAR